MNIFKNIADVKKFVGDCKSKNLKIAFVPTMGALHLGHLSLIKHAQKFADIVIVSIFVNKLQFNDQNDFAKYPRNYDNDILMLKNQGIDAVFLPSDDELYPTKPNFKIIAQNYADCLCGKYRAGHFEGVCIVVSKLFNIVEPNVAFFGLKDYQQYLIIKKLVDDLNFNTEIMGVETYRQDNGLAMSSRNELLSPSAKIKAGLIYKTLQEIKNNPDLIEDKKIELLKNGFERIDYIEIRNALNLQIENPRKTDQKYRIFIALYLEGIRLIDNIEL